MARKLISTPPGTTAVLWNKKTYLVGQEVPDDFPEARLSYQVPEAGEAVAAPASTGEGGDGSEGSGKGPGKKAKKAKK